MRLLSLVFATLLFAGCATDQRTAESDVATAPDSVASADVGKDDSKTIYCTREPIIGTRLPQRRICRTAEEWRTITESSQESLEDLQRRPQPMSESDFGG